jgi:hypothetical protein
MTTEFLGLCRVCDPIMAEGAHVFTSEPERSRWGNEHRDETGHDHWFLATVVDGEPSVVIDLCAGAVTEMVPPDHPEADRPWPKSEDV